MKVDFDPEFFEWLGREPGVVELTREGAEKIAAIARASAPVASGEYRDSIGVMRSPRGGRVVWRVDADCDHALAVEARTGNLARATRAASNG